MHAEHWREKFAFALRVAEEILIFVLGGWSSYLGAALEFALCQSKNAHSPRASNGRLWAEVYLIMALQRLWFIPAFSLHKRYWFCKFIALQTADWINVQVQRQEHIKIKSENTMRHSRAGR
jgi:hypothetical protein